MKPFNYVEINGMKLSDPGQVYSLLWRKLGGKQTSSKLALRCLQEYFKKAKQATVVLLDELDALLKRKHSVLYHFFEWTGWRHSRLIIIAISNTMDLPERFLSNRIVSRMGLCRINFKPYSYKQLQDILQYRLPKHHHLFHPDAAEHIGRKVSSVSGDARRALAFANRTVDMIIAKYRQESLGEPTKHSISLAITLRVFNDASCGNPASVIQGLPKFQIVLLESILMAQKASDLSFSNVP